MARAAGGSGLRVLVVEDHDETRELLVAALGDEGYAVRGAADLGQARDCLETATHDVVVLDWGLPDGDGLDLCRELRTTADGPLVLVLTARGEVDDRVRGLDAGADDYLRKPFALAELRARVRALSRRGPRLDMSVARLGNADVRLSERRVVVGGRTVPMTDREFSIIEILLRRRGSVVPRADILEGVWGEVSPRTESILDVFVSRIRRKLGTGAGDGPIVTHRGVGYSIRYPA